MLINAVLNGADWDVVVKHGLHERSFADFKMAWQVLTHYRGLYGITPTLDTFERELSRTVRDLKDPESRWEHYADTSDPIEVYCQHAVDHLRGRRVYDLLGVAIDKWHLGKRDDLDSVLRQAL